MWYAFYSEPESGPDRDIVARSRVGPTGAGCDRCAPTHLRCVSKYERQCPSTVSASENFLNRAYSGRPVSAAGGQQTINQGFLQVARSRGVFHTWGISFPGEQKHTMANAMADPIARRPGIIRRSLGGVALKFVSHLIRPTIITAMMAALIATADTPTVVPLTCGITWTRTGGVWIFLPDCSHQVPPSQLPPDGPPSVPIHHHRVSHQLRKQSC